MLLSLGPLAGCSGLDNCPDGQDPIVVTSGRSDDQNLFYESARWNQLDAFPAKTQLVFRHALGVTPLEVAIYVSFTRDGTKDKDGGSVSLAAGNEALIECVDSHVIVVKNDTCEKSFFVRVTASGKSTDDNGDACGYRD